MNEWMKKKYVNNKQKIKKKIRTNVEWKNSK